MWGMKIGKEKWNDLVSHSSFSTNPISRYGLFHNPDPVGYLNPEIPSNFCVNPEISHYFLVKSRSRFFLNPEISHIFFANPEIPHKSRRKKAQSRNPATLEPSPT